MSSSPEDKASTPEVFSSLKTKTPLKDSAGFASIKVALGYVIKYIKPADAFKIGKKMNQKGGFDCPGCAWPDPDDERSSLGEFCENGIKAMAEEAQNKTIGSEFFTKYSVDELASWSDFEIGKSGRLSEPMFLSEGASHYKPISWDEAFNKVGTHLNALNIS